ncbi:GNAT family N-acetyltransferase [Streptomyces europaeiscabiei]|uniref:GNAT family N-acetyltransferase n=1 Tax=Streptomyces europaeiscabiei TaxID=146819 RepID=UPI0029B9340A|nr:GNAT family N-acetyltransferase [Streptomyces europaeiscabiei]MDX3616036.1 GNAT family N-acetyltransferase [Streptomyces europaeiscabiei]MDX3631282.1 GNAT family N-acetyltransferase [Streptomyces europaeiscabiei]MDX3647762.1 GNAT family N-acetyltransferase [Streptomyces europaeiscabiei]WUD32440.1 GNAT family N-acetyltransferase [Streptomyces europaeiscabiei]
MGLVRRATAEDAVEVLRLRQVMIDSMSPPGSGGPTDWHAESLPTLRRRLAGSDGEFAAFVVDRPERPGTLAALVVGTIDYRIGKPGNPRGAVGHVFSVATDPDCRRRGYARACMEALVDWFREVGAGYVHLTASTDAEPLYESMGFRRRPDPLMQLDL